jgi:hypothetical protein
MFGTSGAEINMHATSLASRNPREQWFTFAPLQVARFTVIVGAGPQFTQASPSRKGS